MKERLPVWALSLDEVQRVVEMVRANPAFGRRIDQGFRQVLLHRFPFSIIYALESDAILVRCGGTPATATGYWKVRV
jgi:hypothetical protein